MEFIKKNKIGFALGLLLVFVGFSALSYRLINPQNYVKPKRGDVVESTYGLGTVTADKTFRVRTGITVSVRKIFVAEGDVVKVGTPLVEFDENTVKSTIDGTVTGVFYKPGEVVSAQSSVMTVTNLEHLFLEVSLEQQSVLRIKKDQSVAISFESLRSEKYQGVVASVYPRENQFIVRIELKDWPQGVLPGMTADVAILVGMKKAVLLAPLKSIVAGQITRLRAGNKERVPVKLGIVDGEWAELLSDNILESDEILLRR